MLVLYNSNTAGITSGEGTVNPSSTPEFTLVFSGVHVAQSIAVFVDHSLSFFFWSCYCLFYLRLLITTLVSSMSFFVICSFDTTDNMEYRLSLINSVAMYNWILKICVYDTAKMVVNEIKVTR